MIGRGAKEVSPDSLEEMIESMGGDLSATVSIDSTVLTFHVSADVLDKALDLLRLIVLQPEFSEEALAAVRRTYYYELAEKRRNAEFVGHRHLLRVLFENHPYQTATFAEDVLKYVSLRDILAFYARYYRPNNAFFLVSGDVDGPAVARKIGQRFGAWVRRDVDRSLPPSPSPNLKERVCFIDHPTSEGFVVFVGNLAMPPLSPDYYPFLVLNQVLGGTMGSRLFMNLRESKGYAYEAFSEAESFRSCGVYWARARVTSETIHAAVLEIVRELRSLSSEKVAPEEIEQAKSFLIGNLPLKFNSLESYSERLSQVVALGLGPAHWGNASDNLMLVNSDRVLEAGQRYLVQTPVVIIVGNREWAAQALRDFSVVEVYDSTGAFKLSLRQGVEK
jgi:predicted Zn-dependent peptidase